MAGAFGPDGMVDRLCEATNAHDLEALVACFAPDYRNETPAHPERSFVGREQVRKNWQEIFAGVPDITSEVLSRSVNGNVVWSEWEHRGTRRDGSPHVMLGVAIFGVDDGIASWCRFYLEPVEVGGDDVDAFRSRQVRGGGPA